MYIKKILLVIAFMGLLGGGCFAFYVYQAIFSPNTSFKSETVVLEIPAGIKYADFKKIIHPLLKDNSSFDRMALKKGYAKNIKAGRFVIKKGWSNNEIVDFLNKK